MGSTEFMENSTRSSSHKDARVARRALFPELIGRLMSEIRQIKFGDMDSVILDSQRQKQ